MIIGIWMVVGAGVTLVLIGRVFGPDFFNITEREWQTAITVIVLSTFATTGLYISAKQANYADPLSDGLTRSGNFYLFDLKRGFRVVHRRWSPVGRGPSRNSDYNR